MKKIISLVLAFVLAFSCLTMISSAAKKQPAPVASVSLADGAKEDLSATNWFKAANGEYYFFLSALYASAESVRLWFDGTAKLNGNTVESGSAIPVQDGTLEISGVSCKFHFLNSSKIGSIYIETESGSMAAIDADEEHNTQEAGKILIADEKGKTVYDGGLKSIKGRGNASWKMDKKGYNIKLKEKENLFKMGKSAKWCLIANHVDKALTRNALMYGAALKAGMEFTPLYVPVDVYFNGEYAGSYILTTKIEAAKTRINIDNLDDYNEEAAIDFYDDEDFEMDTLERKGVYGSKSGLLEGTQKWVDVPEIKNEDYNVTGGYILELEIPDRYPQEISGFVTNGGQAVIFKCPEYASEEQIKYISDYYQRFEDAVFSESGTNSKGEAYGDLADVDTFVEYYLISEWCSNIDTGLTSTYIYKDVDGKLCAGPVWDYDNGFGNNFLGRFGNDYTNPEVFTVCFNRQYKNTIFGGNDVYHVPTLFNQLCTRQEFVDACKAKWDGGFSDILKNWAAEDYDTYVAKIEDSAVMNAIRWNMFNTCDPEQARTAFRTETDAVKDFALKRINFLTANLGTVQVKEDNSNFFKDLWNGFLLKINNFVEKMIVTFGLQNI